MMLVTCENRVCVYSLIICVYFFVKPFVTYRNQTCTNKFVERLFIVYDKSVKYSIAKLFIKVGQNEKLVFMIISTSSALKCSCHILEF